MAESLALAQEDKHSANYMLPYCRAAVNKEEISRPADGVVRGVCIGIIEAIDFMMSEYPPEEKEREAAHLLECLSIKLCVWSLPT